jgi:hypothetical protein
VIEQQRRIHELESRAEQEQHQPVEAQTREEPRQQEVVRTEPPAFLRKQEESRPEPVAEAPRVDPKKLLDDAGLVMVETDRAKAPAAPYVPEEPAHLGRPRRERSRSGQPQEDELQQVETKR